MPARLRQKLLGVVALTLLSGHVAPAVDANNRYLKLTPLGDRVRIVYTVFYGEIPGASVRRTIDTNHDGQIDDAEARAFAGGLASQVAAGLDLELDGSHVPVHWDEVDPGMGTPATAAGAFSIDLVTSPCFEHGAGKHRLVVHDHFQIDRPGETEARVEDSPGVTIERAHVGSAEDPGHDYLFPGAGGPLAEDGLEVEFDVGPDAVIADDRCRAAVAPVRGDGTSSVLWVGLAVVAAVAGVVIALFVLSRRRTRP